MPKKNSMERQTPNRPLLPAAYIPYIGMSNNIAIMSTPTDSDRDWMRLESKEAIRW